MSSRYVGGYLDPTRLYKFGERFYDPAIGRFTQQDPVYDPLDPKYWNRYVYVGGDPVNFFDPSGLGFCPCGKNPNGSCRGYGVVKKAKCMAGKLNPFGGAWQGQLMAGGAGAGGAGTAAVKYGHQRAREPPKIGITLTATATALEIGVAMPFLVLGAALIFGAGVAAYMACRN